MRTPVVRSTRRRTLVAPDKFKGSISATGVAEAVGRGIRSARPDADVVRVPVADGGDGTVDAALACGFQRVEVRAHGPGGEPTATAYARRDGTAVVELADACGLARVRSGTLDPLGASSRGLGDVVRAALDDGCRELVIGIGGSASTDGGAGMLAALGARGPDGAPERLWSGGAGLLGLTGLDLGGLHPRLSVTRLVVASDVDNPLSGQAGAAHVYGPQKGASAAQVEALDRALDHWADLVAESTGRDLRATPGAGAAGGVGLAALAALGAELRPGIDVLLDLVGFDEALEGCDLVVTGEGSLDEQSLRGKAPVGVAARARRRGIPAVAICGQNVLAPEALRAAGFAGAYSLLEVEPDIGRCLRDPAELLERLGERIAVTYLR